MKAFFVSTIIFFVMIAVITLNYIYINNTADKLLEYVERIASDAPDLSERVSKLEDFWEQNKDKMDLTTNHTSINSIGIKITNIRLFADNHDALQLAREVLLLSEEITEMRRLESVSIGNIF